MNSVKNKPKFFHMMGDNVILSDYGLRFFYASNKVKQSSENLLPVVMLEVA